MPLVMLILLSGGLALGFVWKRNLFPVVLIALGIAIGLGIWIGDWSFMRSPSYVLRNIIYMSLAIAGYFGVIITPMVAGSVAGFFLRKALCRK